ncbi:hypothetical protein VNO77_39257 [Canavalia gladiata]|uniref:Uncharacterized protein n=1 Tax=Canavalia gladiata TaxID=3824 RepID=A0AAN9KE33_CANGL
MHPWKKIKAEFLYSNQFVPDFLCNMLAHKFDNFLIVIVHSHLDSSSSMDQFPSTFFKSNSLSCPLMVPTKCRLYSKDLGVSYYEYPSHPSIRLFVLPFKILFPPWFHIAPATVLHFGLLYAYRPNFDINSIPLILLDVDFEDDLCFVAFSNSMFNKVFSFWCAFSFAYSSTMIPMKFPIMVAMNWKKSSFHACEGVPIQHTYPRRLRATSVELHCLIFCSQSSNTSFISSIKVGVSSFYSSFRRIRSPPSSDTLIEKTPFCLELL